MAREVAEKPPLAVEAIKKMLRLAQGPTLREAMRQETELFGEPVPLRTKGKG